MKMRNAKGFTLIRQPADRRGDHRHHRGDRGSRSVAAACRATRRRRSGSMRAVNGGQPIVELRWRWLRPVARRPPKAPGSSNAGFISPDLSVNGVVKSGYAVNVGPGRSPLW